MYRRELEENYVQKHLSDATHYQSQYSDDFTRKRHVGKLKMHNRPEAFSSAFSSAPKEDVLWGKHRMHPTSDPEAPHRDLFSENSNTFSLDTRILQPMKGHYVPPAQV